MKKLPVLLFALFCMSAAHAISSFTIKDIRVQGVQRTTAGTVFNYLPVKVGDNMNAARAQESIRALFKTGFYSDVRLEAEGDTLTVIVIERPSIDSIKISGTKDIDEATLKKTLKGVGLAEGRIFNRKLLEQTEQELKRQYFARGRYAVKVKPTVKNLERNRVAISLDVVEGEVARIRQINIVGNKTFSDKELRTKFSLSTPTLFSFLSKNDQYAKQKLAADIEGLRSFYLNQGYLEFNVESTQVSISPDKLGIYITVNIAEGARYRISDYKLAGKFIVPEAELRALIGIKPGDVYSRQALVEASKRVTDRLGNEGYAFANVNPIPDIDKQKREARFTFFIDPGQRVYVRRIAFSGNLHTRDEVLRREMRQFEGAWYAADKIQRSVVRLRRLGFFDEVTVDTPAVPGTPDQVDVNITVKERETGSLMAGIGYSDVQGVLLNGSVSMRNLAGTGKELSVNVDNSIAFRNYHLNYVNPYATPDGVSRGFNVFSNRYDASRAYAYTAAYKLSTIGAGMNYGIPISEDRTVTLGIAAERRTFGVGPTSAQAAQDFVARYGEKTDSYTGTFAWSHNSVDDPLFPRKGSFQRASSEIGLPGGDISFYLLNYVNTWYAPLSDRLTFKIRGEAGYGDGYGATEEFPFYKNLFAGGATSVRGYRARTLGPRDPLTGAPIGGSRRILFNTEVLFPVPGAAKDNKSMRLSAFVDGGMVYAAGQPMDVGELRYSAGLAFNWFSPIAPLTISFGVPLNAREGDTADRVQFTLGTIFR